MNYHKIKRKKSITTCVLRCWSKIAFCRKNLSHSSHLYGFWFVWIRRCCQNSKEEKTVKTFIHNLFTRIYRNLIQNCPLPEKSLTISAAKRFLVRVDPQMLHERTLLAKSFAARVTRIRSRFDVNAAMLQNGVLLFELQLTDRTAEEEGRGKGRFGGGAVKKTFKV